MAVFIIEKKNILFVPNVVRLSINAIGLLKRPQIGLCALSVKSICMRMWNNEDLV